MRLATLITTSGSRLHVRADDGGYVDIGEATGEDRFARFESFIAAGPAAMETARGLRGRAGREFAPWEFGPAVPAPERILCLGLNYAEHALEGGRAVPAWPDTFVRASQTLIGPYADLVKPDLTERFDYEGELGIVIGAGGRYIPASKAIDAIAGFTVLNDASARDWQRAGTQWTPGKNFDGTMPIGPEIVTPDEVDISLIVEQRARAVLAISDYTYVLGGGQVLMADTPARLNASQEFTESFFGVGPTTPKTS